MSGFSVRLGLLAESGGNAFGGDDPAPFMGLGSGELKRGSRICEVSNDNLHLEV